MTSQSKIKLIFLISVKNSSTCDPKRVKNRKWWKNETSSMLIVLLPCIFSSFYRILCRVDSAEIKDNTFVCLRWRRAISRVSVCDVHSRLNWAHQVACLSSLANQWLLGSIRVAAITFCKRWYFGWIEKITEIWRVQSTKKTFWVCIVLNSLWPKIVVALSPSPSAPMATITSWTRSSTRLGVATPTFTIIFRRS